MTKVTTFSRTFPAYHPRKGQATFFVEQILNELKVSYKGHSYLSKLIDFNKKNIDNGKLTFEDLESFFLSLNHEIDANKLHTIRNGNRFQVGQKFSPRVWFGKPYNSPQIIFCDDIEVKKTFEFEINKYGTIYSPIIKQHPYHHIISQVANNDGLYLNDLEAWFRLNKPNPKPFKGQIICWSDNVNY